MKKYFLMAIKKGNVLAMYNLGHYFQCIEQNYDEMITYYMMAIEKNYLDAMYNLGLYYESIKKYDDMEKYYLMAIITKLNMTNLI